MCDTHRPLIIAIVYPFSNVKLMEYIRNRVNSTDLKVDFKARDLNLEQSRSSRNCTKLEQELKMFIIERVLGCLLQVDSGSEFLERFDKRRWNAGRVVGLGEVAALFDKCTLARLKRECGGLKTLLRNCHQLFLTFGRDRVRVRVWRAGDGEQAKAAKTKSKPCLFERVHPDGCLLRGDECPFMHGGDESELKME